MDNSHNADNLEGIAVVGMAGKFPGAKNVEQLWQNLKNNVESITTFSEAELIELGIDPHLVRHPNYVKAKGILDDIELFDAAFFGFSPREAAITDPQHRLFLESAWEALENAGYNPEIYPGAIGVYAGVGMSAYFLNHLFSNPDVIQSAGAYQILIANDKDFLPTRVSYKFNLKGPSINIQTACSTSLVATCMACQSLLTYQCDIALAGGVSISLPQKTGYLYQEGMIFSPDGHCRAFDAEAKGTVAGNGLGIVVLKRLEDAIADGDTIHAVIKGFALNNDGSLKVGYTAPSIEGQAEVIAQALAMADFDPETITYIEAHGTGTPLGDPIEIAALTKAFQASTEKQNFCAIGSVKTNLGHLDSAAGVTGLIKTIQALKHQTLPASLHFQTPNPKIDFANSPFYVNSQLSHWESKDAPRRAGVSSFGIGGTNAHLVLEEAPILEKSGTSRPAQLLVISAKTEAALNTATENLIDFFQQYPDTNIADIAYTLATGRKAFNYRRIIVCSDTKDAAIALSNLDPKRVFTQQQIEQNQPITFMFSGQGSQYINMGWELYHVEPVFRSQVDQCSALLKPEIGFDLREILYPSAENTQTATEKLKQTAITQPALFVIEYALAQLWISWGIRPQAMIGHSIGEYVAACLAGVVSLKAALSLVAARGKLMQQMPPGAMLAVPLPEIEARSLLNENLSLAVINTASSCVISGSIAAVDKLEQQLKERNIEGRRLHTSHAFHSQMMEPILAPFIECIKTVKLHPPQIPYISNVTGTWITATAATDPNYWAQHLRQTVRFAEGLQPLMQDPNRIFLEVGPGRTLMSLAKQHPAKSSSALILSSLRHPQEEQSDLAFLLTNLGKLWLAGVGIQWSQFYADERRYRLPLPTYPFERQRYWIEPKSGKSDALLADGIQFSKQSEIANWFYTPTWQRSVLLPTQTDLLNQQNCWLIFVDKSGFGAEIANQLNHHNQTVISVKIGEKFESGLNHYTLNPSQRNDYDALWQALESTETIPQHIVHCWSVTPASQSPQSIEESLEQTQSLGFWSLLFLAQAIGKANYSDRLEISVISNDVQEVTGTEILCPEKATLLGPCHVIPQEYPHIHCRSIDVTVPQSNTQKITQLIEHLLNEFTQETSESAIAYRGNYRWIQTFAPVPLAAAEKQNLPLKTGGVYLITGGLGGIGLVLADYLATTVQAKLILVGRSHFPGKSEWETWLETHDSTDPTSQKIQQLQTLETSGAEIMIACADVANREQMQTVISQGCDRFGTIHGVIHAAGMGPTGTIQYKTPEMAANLLAPKVQGTLILNNLLQHFNLDFFVLCSSLNSFLAFPGVVDYCAANAFLDAFAQAKRDRTPYTVAINWDTWQQVGLAANTAVPAALQKWREQSLQQGITPTEGIEVFSRILTSKLPQVIVSTQDFLPRLQQHRQSNPLSYLEQPQPNSSQPQHSRPNLGNPYIAPRTDLEQTLADIWQKCLDVQPIGVFDDFFELGGDSLLAVHLLSKISEATASKLSPHSLIDAPTIAALTQSIPGTDTPAPKTQTLPPSLVKLQSGNSQNPLFLIHAAGGHVYQYRNLAHHLGSDQLVYGIQSESVTVETDLLTEVETMAAHYLEAVRVVQPKGPYFLGGASFGGTIAYEMAQQLHAIGETVHLLALIDTPSLGQMPELNLEENEPQMIAYFLGVGANLPVTTDFLEKLSSDEQWRYFLDVGKTELNFPETFGVAEIRRYYDLFKMNIKAMRKYVPQPYSGPILFFRASDRDRFNPQNPELGWLHLATSGLEIYQVPGNHITMNFAPNVQAIAEKLKPYLHP